MPVNAQIEHEADVDIESVAVDSILKQMEFSGAKTSIVILDTCRNNPLARGFRSATRGLARMEAPNESFIAYSTAAGDVAADGAGKNAPFASALAVEMVKPDQAIEETFRNVRIQVMADTAQKQTPWDSSSMILQFYFAGQKQLVVGMEPADAPATTSQPVGSAGAPSSNEVGERLSEHASVAPAVAALDADFVSPLPDGTIVLSHKVKE